MNDTPDNQKPASWEHAMLEEDARAAAAVRDSHNSRLLAASRRVVVNEFKASARYRSSGFFDVLHGDLGGEFDTESRYKVACHMKAPYDEHENRYTDGPRYERIVVNWEATYDPAYWLSDDLNKINYLLAEARAEQPHRTQMTYALEEIRVTRNPAYRDSNIEVKVSILDKVKSFFRRN